MLWSTLQRKSSTVTWILAVLYQLLTSNLPSPVLYWKGECIQHDYSPPWTGIHHIHQVSWIVLHICRLAFCSVLCVQTDRCGQIQAVRHPHRTEPRFPSAAFQSQLCIPLKMNTMTKLNIRIMWNFKMLTLLKVKGTIMHRNNLKWQLNNPVTARGFMSSGMWWCHWASGSFCFKES